MLFYSLINLKNLFTKRPSKRQNKLILNLVRLQINSLWSFKHIMTQQESLIMVNMDFISLMIKIKKSTKSTLSKDLFMISAGIKRDKTLSLLVVLCHHILSCLINTINKSLNSEIITEIKLFGEILVDSYV